MDVAVVVAVDHPVLERDGRHALGRRRGKPVLAVVLVGEQDARGPQTAKDPPDPVAGAELVREHGTGRRDHPSAKLRTQVDAGDLDRRLMDRVDDPVHVHDRVAHLRRAEAQRVDREEARMVRRCEPPPAGVLLDPRPDVQLDRLERGAAELVGDGPRYAFIVRTCPSTSTRCSACSRTTRSRPCSFASISNRRVKAASRCARSCSIS